MDKEIWELSYYMIKENGGTVLVSEGVECERGYYNRLRGFWALEGRPHSERNPIEKVRKNRVALLLRDSITLPINQRASLDGAELLFAEEYTIKMTAPDGRVFVYKYE